MRWPKYWSFSLTSFVPKKSQGWSPSEWTGWISLQSKGPSRVFSNTTVQKHRFFSIQLSSQSQLSHPYMTTGKTIALTRWTFVVVTNKSPVALKKGPTPRLASQLLTKLLWWSKQFIRWLIFDILKLIAIYTTAAVTGVALQTSIQTHNFIQN